MLFAQMVHVTWPAPSSTLPRTLDLGSDLGSAIASISNGLLGEWVWGPGPGARGPRVELLPFMWTEVGGGRSCTPAPPNPSSCLHKVPKGRGRCGHTCLSLAFGVAFGRGVCGAKGRDAVLDVVLGRGGVWGWASIFVSVCSRFPGPPRPSTATVQIKPQVVIPSQFWGLESEIKLWEGTPPPASSRSGDSGRPCHMPSVPCVWLVLQVRAPVPLDEGPS